MFLNLTTGGVRVEKKNSSFDGISLHDIAKNIFISQHFAFDLLRLNPGQKGQIFQNRNFSQVDLIFS